VQLVSKISNLCHHNPPTSQTDRRTDRQTTCDRKTLLCSCTKVHCTVKIACLDGGNRMSYGPDQDIVVPKHLTVLVPLGVDSVEESRTPSPVCGSGAMPPENVSPKSRFFRHFCKLKWSLLQWRQGRIRIKSNKKAVLSQR